VRLFEFCEIGREHILRLLVQLPIVLAFFAHLAFASLRAAFAFCHLYFLPGRWWRVGLPDALILPHRPRTFARRLWRGLLGPVDVQAFPLSNRYRPDGLPKFFNSLGVGGIVIGRPACLHVGVLSPLFLCCLKDRLTR
jgi:hypothetical protein